MEYDREKVDQMALALLYLTTSRDKYGARAWKGWGWEVWDRLLAGEVWGRWLFLSAPVIGIISTGTERGAHVIRVSPGTSAAEAGLRVGDLIEKMDDQPVLSYLDMEGIKACKDPGDMVKLSIKRGGQSLTLNVRLMPNHPVRVH